MCDDVGVQSELSILSELSRAFTNTAVLGTAVRVLLRAMNLGIPEQFNNSRYQVLTGVVLSSVMWCHIVW
jgi:hypothetical protein